MSISINKEKCKGCLYCAEFCPQKVFSLSGGINEKGMRFVTAEKAKKCTGCGLCFIMCPDCAVEIE